MSKEAKVHFLAVGRTSDQVIVACHSFHSDVDLSVVEKTFGQPNVKSVAPDKLCSFNVSDMTWWLQKDQGGLIYIMMTLSNFPTSAALNCLRDLQADFTSEFRTQAESCAPRGLTRKAAKLLTRIKTKYDALEQVDALTRVQGKLEATKLTMQENMQLALQACVKLEDINVAAENLALQSNMFADNARELRKKMWWKQCKLKLLIGFIVLVILIIIAAVIGVKVAASKAAAKAASGATHH